MAHRGTSRDIPPLRAAIARTEARIMAMDREWRDAGGACCPSCMFGAPYHELERKLSRQEAQLRILLPLPLPPLLVAEAAENSAAVRRNAAGRRISPHGGPPLDDCDCGSCCRSRQKPRLF